MNFNTHKDKLPQDTINEIRNILTDLGIFTTEKKWNSVTSNCFSVFLGSSMLQCFTNGKGVTEEYALASAYAEFIERLQADYLLTNKFGIMENNNIESQDIETTLGFYAEQNESIIKNTVDPRIVKKYRELKIKSFPVYEVIEEQVKYLPYFVASTFRSNGICAGNTPQEALCQGICEIFERHVIKEVYFNNSIELPTIPLAVLKNLEIYQIIDDIVKRGYKLIIKDCTLNGKLPVVGVILLNKNKTSYIYRFGSDPLFEVALQRCLTELFQGKDEATLNNRFNNKLDFSPGQYKNKEFFSEDDNRKVQYEKTIISTNGELPCNVFISAKETFDYKNGFQKEFKNHKDSLNFLTSIIKKNNYKMYVQDISTLGFPSFKIFIPELSIINKVNYQTFIVYYAEKNFIKTVLLKLQKSSDEDILKCAEYLEPLLEIPEEYFICRSILNSLVNVIINESSHLRQFDNLLYLLGMLFFRVGKFEKAFKYLNQYIKEFGKDFSNIDYYNCVLLYLKLKINELSENEIRIILKNTFGENLSNEIMIDLANPENCFKYFILPECGNCSSCPIKKECRYEAWKQINLKIVQKIKSNPIKQENVGKIFQNLK